MTITSCTKADSYKTDLAIFLENYNFVHPEYYNFENNYYNLTSFNASSLIIRVYLLRKPTMLVANLNYRARPIQLMNLN